jgi:hypothetical protein
MAVFMGKSSTDIDLREFSIATFDYKRVDGVTTGHHLFVGQNQRNQSPL